MGFRWELCTNLETHAHTRNVADKSSLSGNLSITSDRSSAAVRTDWIILDSEADSAVSLVTAFSGHDPLKDNKAGPCHRLPDFDR